MPLQCNGAAQTMICGLIIGIILETIILAVLVAHCVQNDGTTINICKYPSSNKTSEIINQIDKDVDPCHDFPKFVCGHSLYNSFRELGDEAHTQINDLIKQFSPKGQHIVLKTAMKLFQNCINGPTVPNKHDEYLQSLLKALNDAVGGWPLLPDSQWNETEFDWVQATYKLKELGFPYTVFFDFLVEVNQNDEKDYVLKVLVPKLKLNQEIVREVAKLFGADRNQIYPEIQEIQEFVYNMNNNLENDEFRLVNDSQYDNTMDWGGFINRTVGPRLQMFKQHIKIFPQTHEMIDRLKVLASTHKRIQANYMVWKVLEEMIDLRYPSCLRELPATVHRYDIITEEEDCFNVLSRRFLINPIAIMYARKHIPETRSNTAKVLMMNIKREFLELLNKANWMDKVDKENTINRVDSMQILIGVPEKYYSDHILDEMNAELKETTDESALSLILQVNKNYQALLYKQINSSLPKFDFTNLNRPIYKLEYSYTNNTLSIPIGFLQDFVFDDKLPNYFNYGSLGTILGSQFIYIFEKLIHGYPRTNFSRFNHEYFWANKTKEVFATQMNCLATQVKDTIIFDDTGEWNYIIQRQTLGVTLSYAAYKKWSLANIPEPTLAGFNYTPKQLFWISSSKFWCGKLKKEDNSWDINAEYGVISSNTMNTEDFAKDFNCPINSKMNPAQKCKIF